MPTINPETKNITLQRVPLSKAFVYTLEGTKKVSEIEAIKGSPLVYGDIIYRKDENAHLIPDKKCLADYVNGWILPITGNIIETQEDYIRTVLKMRGISQDIINIIDPLITGKIN